MSDIANSVVASLIALLLTLAVIGVAAYELTNGKPVNIPDTLTSPWLLIVGFYFGGHTSNESVKVAGNAAASAVSATVNGR